MNGYAGCMNGVAVGGPHVRLPDCRLSRNLPWDITLDHGNQKVYESVEATSGRRHFIETRLGLLPSLPLRTLFHHFLFAIHYCDCLLQ
jgi:hypothetical protein